MIHEISKLFWHFYVIILDSIINHIGTFFLKAFNFSGLKTLPLHNTKTTFLLKFLLLFLGLLIGSLAFYVVWALIQPCKSTNYNVMIGLTMLERATLFLGTTSVTSNVAFTAGSSQQGKARRASVAYRV